MHSVFTKKFVKNQPQWLFRKGLLFGPLCAIRIKSFTTDITLNSQAAG